MSARRIERGIAVAIGALVVCAALFSGLAESETKATPGSAESIEPQGRRVLFLVLDALGFAPEVWRSAPERLPKGAHVLWMARAPENSDDAVLDVPERYCQFLHGGGTIVMPATPASIDFLVDDLGQASCADLALDVEDADESRDAPAILVTTRDGESWRAQWDPARSWRIEDLGRDTLDLWTIESAGEERAVAVVVPGEHEGNGSIVLLADDRFLSNERLPMEDHALLAERLAESVHASGRLLFDEYALGLWKPQSAVELATSPRILPLTLQLAALFLLLAWRRVWTGRFPRDPEPSAALSPLSRARALAAVYERAGRTAVLAGFLREGVLRRLRARVRAPADAPLADLVQRAPELARFERSLAPRPILRPADLAELSRELAQCERELDATVRRRATRTR